MHIYFPTNVSFFTSWFLVSFLHCSTYFYYAGENKNISSNGFKNYANFVQVIIGSEYFVFIVLEILYFCKISQKTLS